MFGGFEGWRFRFWDLGWMVVSSGDEIHVVCLFVRSFISFIVYKITHGRDESIRIDV